MRPAMVMAALLVMGLWPLELARAARISSTSVLVTEGNVLREYSRGGNLLQSFPIPFPAPVWHEAHGVVMNVDGSVYVRNSAPSGDDYFSRLDPLTNSWSHVLASGIDSGNVSDADLSARGSIAVTNGRRLDMMTQQVTSFLVPGQRGAGEVSWGLDGLLYALDSGSPRGRVRVLDPHDYSLIRELRLYNENGLRLDARGIAVTSAGEMFLADWDGRIYEYTPNGALIKSVGTGSYNLLNINLHPDGALVVGGRSGDVVITDTSLASMRRYSVGTDLAYASFAAPEPSTGALAGLAGLVVVALAVARRSRV